MTNEAKATGATVATVAAASADKLEAVHALLGWVHEIGAAIVAILTVAWWLRIWWKKFKTGDETPPPKL